MNVIEEKIILGENCEYETDITKTGVNNNVLVCGSSGCGKTVSIIEPRLLNTTQSSLIVTVTKRRIVDKYKRILKRRGFKVLDLNFVEPHKSNIGFNPLAYIETAKDIKFLAEALVMANPKKERTSADPYWDSAAISLLRTEISAVMLEEDAPSFNDVLNLHNSMILDNGFSGESTCMEIFRVMAEQYPDTFPVSCWKSFKDLPEKTASCVHSTLNSALDSIFTTELREIMNKKNTIDFRELANEKTVLFITTSPVNNSLNYFINVFYSYLFKQLFEYAERQKNGVLPRPVQILYDDFATGGGKIMNFGELISILREKAISVTLLLQSESQLESMYGHSDAITIINNCDSYVYMGGNDIKTASNVSMRLNVPLDEVLYMPIGKIAVFRRGQRPIVTERYDITKEDKCVDVSKHFEKEVSKYNNR